MGKEIIVNVGERETRIAVTEDGKLVELHIEREERVVGSLYKARVENVLPGMDAAFVDVGLERNAFLYVGDVLPTVDDATGAGDAGDSATLMEADVDEEDEDESSEEGGEAGEPTSAGRGPGRRRYSTRRSVLRLQK